jgi:hypothetical protein
MPGENTETTRAALPLLASATQARPWSEVAILGLALSAALSSAMAFSN